MYPKELLYLPNVCIKFYNVALLRYMRVLFQLLVTDCFNTTYIMGVQAGDSLFTYWIIIFPCVPLFIIYYFIKNECYLHLYLSISSFVKQFAK